MTTAVIGQILEEHTEGNNRLGLIEFGSGNGSKRRTIYLNLVPGAHIGDYVSFHAGFATEQIKDLEPALRKRAFSVGEPFATEDEKEPGPEAYEGYRLLSELDPAQLRKLILLAQDRYFDADRIIFRSGETSLFLLLIVAGKVVLEDVSGSQPVQVQTLGAGDAMGWSALTPGGQTHFQARAVTRVSTLAFRGEEVKAAFDRDPAMGYAFMKRLLELVTERLDAARMKLAAQASEVWSSHSAGGS